MPHILLVGRRRMALEESTVGRYGIAPAEAKMQEMHTLRRAHDQTGGGEPSPWC
jgi:hypothetical protein